MCKQSPLTTFRSASTPCSSDRGQGRRGEKGSTRLSSLRADPIPGGGGGLLLSLEKGTDCGPTVVELWLASAKDAKKEGLSSHCECA